MILTPPSCQVLLLSASVENASQFAAWLTNLSNRPTRLVSTNHRPVPLKELIFCQDAWLTKPTIPKKLYREPDGKLDRFPIEHKDLAPRITMLDGMGLTPCLIYCGRRLSCESLASELAQNMERISTEL